MTVSRRRPRGDPFGDMKALCGSQRGLAAKRVFRVRETLAAGPAETLDPGPLPSEDG